MKIKQSKQLKKSLTVMTDLIEQAKTEEDIDYLYDLFDDIRTLLGEIDDEVERLEKEA